MATTKELQAYYDYTGPESGDAKWYVKDTPFLDPMVQERLDEIAGFNDRRPRLRCVWGGTAVSDITEKKQLKYLAIRQINNGYNYVKTDGTIGITKSMNLPSDAKVPWEFHPRQERIELGRLRWIIERHVTAQELVNQGRFQKLHAADGEKILRDLPPEGVYDTFFIIQTRDWKYREPDMQVLAAIEAMWHYEISASVAQKTLDAIEYDQQKILIGAKEAREVWANL